MPRRGMLCHEAAPLPHVLFVPRSGITMVSCAYIHFFRPVDVQWTCAPGVRFLFSPTMSTGCVPCVRSPGPGAVRPGGFLPEDGACACGHQPCWVRHSPRERLPGTRLRHRREQRGRDEGDEGWAWRERRYRRREFVVWRPCIRSCRAPLTPPCFFAIPSLSVCFVRSSTG
jgi:hypothetical protein